MNVSKPVDVRYYYTISLKNIIHASTQIVETNPGTLITMIIIFGLYVFLCLTIAFVKIVMPYLAGQNRHVLDSSAPGSYSSYLIKIEDIIMCFFFKYLLECLFLMYVYVHSLNSFHQYV